MFMLLPVRVCILTRLGISIGSTEVERGKSQREFPGAEKMTGRNTNMNVLYILIIVTKIGECYSTINKLLKLIIEKSFFWPESCIFLLFGAIIYDFCQH